MATITEDYVNFETAKLLKDKGFEEGLDIWFDKNGEVFYSLNYDISSDWRFRQGEITYQRPTLQMVMKWLRRIHNVNIDIVSIWNQKRFEYQVYIVTPENAKHCYIDDKLYLGYEEAVEAAIKYSLENLIYLI